MHVAVEMDLSFSAVEYIVFDEADRCEWLLAAVDARCRGLTRRAYLLACFALTRLFEMGFELQMHEILHRLPESRQSVLFSATLPKALADFAKAGLHDPTLIRLDVDTKISTDLQVRPRPPSVRPNKASSREADCSLLSGLSLASALQLAFFAVPSESKLPFLLYLLRHVIPREQQTIIFVASKHHVEFLQQLLGLMNFAVTYVYGALDQSVRKMNVERFRAGRSKVRPRAQQGQALRPATQQVVDIAHSMCGVATDPRRYRRRGARYRHSAARQRHQRGLPRQAQALCAPRGPRRPRRPSRQGLLHDGA